MDTRISYDITPKIDELRNDLTTSRPVVREFVRPLARTPYYMARGMYARMVARGRVRSGLDLTPAVFVIGCGRSGTTLLGELLSRHPEVSYRYEPYDRWAAVDRRTDFLHLYTSGPCRCFLHFDDVTAVAQRRFRRVMLDRRGTRLVEKSPINALRIGYLEAIAPESRFVHIVRDGLDVAHSIERMAAVTRRMPLRGLLNEWWGIDGVKWSALASDASGAGYFADEVHELETDQERGAYEWLVSLLEVDKWRQRLGSRLVEVRYGALTADPSGTLRHIAEGVGLSCPTDWLNWATRQVRDARTWSGSPLKLPAGICAAFNGLQESFGFAGRAVCDKKDRLQLGDRRRTKPLTTRGSGGRKATSIIDVESIGSLRQSRTIAREWALLAEEDGSTNPFAHPDWMIPWAERFLRKDEQVWLVTARLRDRLVGVAPFYRRTWGHGAAHSLQLWGTGRNCKIFELPQILVSTEHKRPTARSLVTRICAETNSWDWATIPMPAGLWLEPEWLPRGGEITVLQNIVRPSVVLPVGIAEAPAMKRNLKESLRRARNRLDRDYPGQWAVTCATDGIELTEALRDLARLHGERAELSGKKLHPNAIKRSSDWSYLSDVLLRSADHKGACVYRLVVRGQPVAALLAVRTDQCTYVLLSGLSEAAWRYSPTTLLQAIAVEDAAVLGHRSVNLSTGPDRSKLRWSESIELSPEFVLVPDRLVARIKFSVYWQASAIAEFERERNRHKLRRGHVPHVQG